ncbi:hypothetical protein [Enterobacter phage 01_vB_Eclo_IJM]|nr:hypothetical protein [Enterobacter phage 01_vB_Eclo_IJM]
MTNGYPEASKDAQRWLCCELTPITVRSATPSRRLRKMLLVSGKLRSSVVSTTQTRCSASSPDVRSTLRTLPASRLDPDQASLFTTFE